MNSMKPYITYALLASVVTGYGLAGSVGNQRAARPPLNVRQPDDTGRDFPVQAFGQVTINDAFTVTVKAGSACSVKASGRAEDLNAMDVSTRKGVLTVQYKPIKMSKDQNPVINREVVTVTVTMPVLKKGEFRKMARFAIEGFSRSEFVELMAGSQATGSADLTTSRMKLSLDGQSSMTVRGETGQLEARLQGQSGLMAYDLKTRSASVVADGMSKAEVSVTDALQATANGSSQVMYKGQPTVKVSENGESTIKAYKP